MKNLTFCSLTTLGAVLLGLSAQAQVTVTTSTNAVPSPVSTPAVQPDTLRPNSAGMAMPQGDDKETRQNRRERRKNKAKSGGSTVNTNTNDYRQGTMSNGTTVNNSNTTNYNSQNAIAPATGVNAMPPSPSSSGTGGTTSSGAGTANGSMSTGSTMGATTASGSSAVTNAPGTITAANPDRTLNSGNRSKTLSVGDFIAASPNHTTLQNALQTTTLDKTLMGGGPFTVFAPSNEAFKTLPGQTQRVLLEGQNLDALKSLLSNHVVAGEVDAAELTRRIKAGNGKTTLTTLAGKTLTVQEGAGGQLNITDEQGVTASINMPDHYETNGVVHGITKVLTPKGMTPFR